MVLTYILVALAGVLVGIVGSYIFQVVQTAYGTLRIDHTDPEKDLYRIDIDGNFDNIAKEKRIILKVDNDADLSQK